jgi:hypothetical protein
MSNEKNNAKQEAKKIIEFYMGTLYTKVKDSMNITEYMNLCKQLALDRIDSFIVFSYNESCIPQYYFFCEVRDEINNMF